MRLEITWYTDWDGRLAAKWCDSTQAKRVEERGGTPVGAEIPGHQLHSESGAEAADCTARGQVLSRARA
jgi:hypothetical protein